MIVGGYTLHLYCDTGNSRPDCNALAPKVGAHGYNGGSGEFYGKDKRTATTQARRAGWTFKAGGFAYCQKCPQSH